jgi:hypothetical protein
LQSAASDRTLRRCNYEIAFCAMLKYDFEMALRHWLILLEENDWSKVQAPCTPALAAGSLVLARPHRPRAAAPQVFYSYMAGVCLHRLGKRKEALARFHTVKSMDGIKIQNNRLPVDLFCMRRVEQRVTETSVNLPLCHLEVRHWRQRLGGGGRPQGQPKGADPRASWLALASIDSLCLGWILPHGPCLPGRGVGRCGGSVSTAGRDERR